LADFQTRSRNQTSASQINFTRNAGDNFMNISILLMQQIVQLFLMIFMGYLIVKTGLVRDDDSKVLSKIILYLIVPCVIINAFQVDYTTDTVKGLLIAFAASVMTQVILLVVISVAGKLLHLNEVEVSSVYYSNSGNLIVPIVTFILGQEWVLYGCVFMSVQLVFLWTHCKKIISREASYDWKKIILNINMLSIFIGVILFFTKIRLPEIIGNTLASVGTMIGPASMIVTGMLFAGMNLKQIFANKRVYFITFLRLIAVPLIALVLIKFSNLASFSADGNKIMLIVFLAIITPSASTVTQMCQVYGNDSRYASAINVMTTLLSIITMPVMVMLFQMII
jgi:malate permease and related proteins